MIRFEEVGQGKIRCGLPKGKHARVDFAFPLGWVPYVCCDETVITVTSVDQLRTHIEILSLDPIAAEKLCRFLDPQHMTCTHDATTVTPPRQRHTRTHRPCGPEARPP